MNLETISQIASVVVAILALLPSFFAIRKQLRTEDIEAASLKADLADKHIDTASSVQSLYKGMYKDQEEIICRTEKKVDLLTKKNEELKIIVKEQNIKIEILEEITLTLVEQVKELGIEPRYPKE